MKKKIRIWDLPIRIFHWLLVGCMIASFITVNISGNAMQWHAYVGYCILVLILFRVIWGFFGSYHARFLNFVPSPTSLKHYLQGNSKAALGHKPLGSFSVLALLLSVGLQAVTGLFSNDEIAFEGPFSKHVSNATVELLTSIHSINSTILIILIALHLSAIAYYQFFKRENLIKPMLVGDKEIHPGQEEQYSSTDLSRASKDGSLQRGFALMLLSLIAIILGYFITA